MLWLRRSSFMDGSRPRSGGEEAGELHFEGESDSRSLEESAGVRDLAKETTAPDLASLDLMLSSASLEASVSSISSSLLLSFSAASIDFRCIPISAKEEEEDDDEISGS